MNQQELKIALFGESKSGKSVFMASYFGNQQRGNFGKEHNWRLSMKNDGNRTELLDRYHFMAEGGFPGGTETFSEYTFDYRIRKINGSYYPDSAFSVTWYDYPGDWWTKTVEKSALGMRKEAFNKLLESHTAILLVDGEKWKKHRTTYVKKLFDSFRNAIEQIDRNNSEKFPDEWLIAISKSDLLDTDDTVEIIAHEIRKLALEELNALKETLQSNAFGDRFILLSSVKADGQKVINAEKTVGLELIAPLSMRGIAQQAAKAADDQNKDAQKLATQESEKTVLKGIFGVLKWITKNIDKIDDILPKKYQYITQSIKILGVEELLDEKLKDMDSKQAYYENEMRVAAEKGDLLRATIEGMKVELARSATSKAYFSVGMEK